MDNNGVSTARMKAREGAVCFWDLEVGGGVKCITVFERVEEREWEGRGEEEYVWAQVVPLE